MREEWRNIPGFPEWCFVSDYGRFRTLERTTKRGNGVDLLVLEQIHKGSVDSHGYNQVSVEGKGVLLHRLVATAFLENGYSMPCVNHKDFNRQNNKLNNLEWVTHRENTQHAYDAGRISTRRAQLHLQLPKETVAKIMEWRGVFTQKEIALKLGVGVATVSRYQTGKRVHNER